MAFYFSLSSGLKISRIGRGNRIE